MKTLSTWNPMTKYKSKNLSSWIIYRAKQAKLDFEDRLTKITERIVNLKKEIVDINKTLNKRNNTLVSDIVNQIEKLLPSLEGMDTVGPIDGD